MIKLNLVAILALSFLFLSAVSALEVKKTEIVIYTEPYQNLSISILNSGTNEELAVFTGRARKFGEYRFNYYRTVDEILLSASIMNNQTGEVIKNKKFGPYNTNLINFNFSLNELNEAEVETNTEETNDTIQVVESEESAAGKSPIFGFVTGETGRFSNIYYYVGAGALCIIILIIILKGRIKTKTPIEPNPSKIKTDKKTQSKTEVIVPPQNTIPLNSADTEKRISELQKELEQIKNEEKLVQLQRQVSKEKQELKKLQESKEFRSHDFKDNSKIK